MTNRLTPTRARHALGLAVAAGLALSATVLPAADLKFAHMFAPDSLPAQSADKFAELVKEKTGGEVTFTVLPGGALGDEKANMEQLLNGSIDVAILSDLPISAFAPPYKVMGLPFVYKDVDHVLAVYNGEIGAELAQFLYDTNKLHLVTWQYVGNRQLTSNTPVHSLADFKGLKLRLPQNATFVSAFVPTGADIRDIAFTELQLALQTGTVEAQENPPNFIIAQKFYEVQDYLMLTNHYPQLQAFYISDAAYESLSPEMREKVMEAFHETAEWTTATTRASEADQVAWLTDPAKGGMELIDIDMTGIVELNKDLPRTVGGEEGVALMERIQALR